MSKTVEENFSEETTISEKLQNPSTHQKIPLKPKQTKKLPTKQTEVWFAS